MAPSDSVKPAEGTRPDEARTRGSGPEDVTGSAPDTAPTPLVRALCDDLATVLDTPVDPADLQAAITSGTALVSVA